MSTLIYTISGLSLILISIILFIAVIFRYKKNDCENIKKKLLYLSIIPLIIFSLGMYFTLSAIPSITIEKPTTEKIIISDENGIERISKEEVIKENTYNVKLVASDYVILEKDGVEYKYYDMDIVRRSRGKDTIVIKD